MNASATAILLGIGALTASPDARADENDTLYQAISEFCLTNHNSVAAAAKLATKPELDPRGVSIDKGPPYAHQIGLVKLGNGSTVVTFKGPARDKPPTECLFTSYSGDVVQLVSRLRSALSLPEPTKNSLGHNQFEVYGWATAQNRPIIVRIDYGTQDNAQSGGITLKVSDASTDDTARLVAAIRDLCLTPRRTADEAAKAAARTPYAAKDEGLRKSANHERMVRLKFGDARSFATFKASSPNAPLDECEIISSVDDMPRLMTRLRETFGFSAPVADTKPNSWRSAAKTPVGGEPKTSDLSYTLHENMRSGTFMLTVTR